MEHSCAFTGHRPNRFSFGYDEENYRCKRLKRVMEKQIRMLIKKYGIVRFYSGVAQGVDLWAAEIVLKIKKANPKIELVAVVPHEGQADRWNEQTRHRYFIIQEKSDDVIFTGKRYTPDCMFVRNRFLVDHARYLLAVHDGGARGGTGYTVQYAREQGRKIFTIDPESFDITTPADAAAYERRRKFEVIKKEP